MEQTNRFIGYFFRNAKRPEPVHCVVRLEGKAVVVADIVQRTGERIPIDGAAKHGRNVIIVLTIVVVDMQCS